MPTNSAKQSSHDLWHRRLRWFGAMSMVVLGMVCLVNCSTETRYKTLSFFFDGVPDPNNPEGGNSTDSSNNRNFVQRSTHKPFEENNCNACHSGQMTSKTGRLVGFDQLSTPDDTSCMKCHKEVTTQFRYMHGPVAVGACLMCHDPHRSSLPNLLNQEAPGLCLKCHQRQDLGEPLIAHANEKLDCLTCHVGHGASEHGLLRVAMMQNLENGPATGESLEPSPSPAAPVNDMPQTPEGGQGK